MSGFGTGSKKWSLTREALDLFLSRLSSDREQAGLEYERIRAKLRTFFSCNAFSTPEDLVDQTIDRAIRRLGETDVRDVPAFVWGIARFISMEMRKSGAREVSLEETPELAAPPRTDFESAATSERVHHCLDRCLDKLCPEDRNLMLNYYKHDKSQKIETKKLIAAGLGVSTAALRVRAFRTRRQLEICIENCVRSSP